MKVGKPDLGSLGKKLRTAEKELTKGLVKWKLKREGRMPPDEETLEKGSEQLMDEAHRIVKKTGKSIFEDLKKAKKEFLKAYRDEDEK